MHREGGRRGRASGRYIYMNRHTYRETETERTRETDAHMHAYIHTYIHTYVRTYDDGLPHMTEDVRDNVRVSTYE